jgi:histidinol-phosphate aminotransferase
MIKRIFNNSYSHNKLRLHSSERNTEWNDLFDEFKNNLTDKDIRYYPNTNELIEPLSKFFDFGSFLFGNGSDRCIKYFFELYSGYKNVIIVDPTFPMYEIYAQMFNVNVIKVPYLTLEFPIEEILNKIEDDTMVVISNPSSPVGDLISKNNLYKILDEEVPVLIDEAYIEFSDQESIISDIFNYDNLYVTRTFSKAFGSAGTRFGLIFSNEENISKLNQYRDMYEINGLTMKWILILLKNIEKSYEYINNVKINRELLYKELIKKYNVVNSKCNWIHVNDLDISKCDKVIFKTNCYLPNLGNNWTRLQVTDKISNYECILK